MAMQRVTIEQDFQASVAQVFEALADHNRLGEILGQDIRRIVDAPGKNPNGVGSVRRIKPLGVPAFEETVTKLEPGKFLEYRITKGSPIKNHLGRLEFSEQGGGTHLHYTIDFEPKLPIPFLGSILSVAIRGPIAGGLARFARELRAASS